MQSLKAPMASGGGRTAQELHPGCSRATGGCCRVPPNRLRGQAVARGLAVVRLRKDCLLHMMMVILHTYSMHTSHLTRQAEVGMSDVALWNNKRLQTQVLPLAEDTVTIRSLDWDRDRFDIEFG